MLTRKELKKLLKYNQSTGIFIWRQSRKGTKKTDVVGCKQKNGYLQIRVNSKLYKAHRLVWLYVYGYFPKNQIDHINHNKVDNRINNLREVTSQENHKNRKINKNNKSGFNGVYWDNKRNKWIAIVQANKKRNYLGHFTNKNDAIKVRKKANIEYNYHKNHGKKKKVKC